MRKGCGHRRKDHAKPGPKPPHAHHRTRAGDNMPVLFHSTYTGAYCNVAICDCLDFEGSGEICGDWPQANEAR